jgi:hypothetical protein
MRKTVTAVEDLFDLLMPLPLWAGLPLGVGPSRQ